MAIAYHFINDFDTVPNIMMGVRSTHASEMGGGDVPVVQIEAPVAAVPLEARVDGAAVEGLAVDAFGERGVVRLDGETVQVLGLDLVVAVQPQAACTP